MVIHPLADRYERTIRIPALFFNAFITVAPRLGRKKHVYICYIITQGGPEHIVNLPNLAWALTATLIPALTATFHTIRLWWEDFKYIMALLVISWKTSMRNLNNDFKAISTNIYMCVYTYMKRCEICPRDTLTHCGLPYCDIHLDQH